MSDRKFELIKSIINDFEQKDLLVMLKTDINQKIKCEIVKYLVDTGMDVNKICGWDTVLGILVNVQATDAVRFLIKKDADVNKTSETPGSIIPLDYAIVNGNMELVKLIVEEGHGDVNHLTRKDYTPLFIAIENKRHDIARYLVEHGADVNTFNGIHKYTPLMEAVRRKDIDMVKFLVEHDADVNIVAPGNAKHTALKIAKCLPMKGFALYLQNHGAYD